MSTKTHAHLVIHNGEIVHTGTLRGCRTYVTRRGVGRVITTADAEVIAERDKLRAALVQAEAKAAAELVERGFSAGSFGNPPEKWRSPTSCRVEATGELGRSLIALAKLEHGNKFWCGSWDGGAHAWHAGTYFGGVMHGNAEAYLANLARYAREAYRFYRIQGNRAGMMVAAELLAATANHEELTYVTPAASAAA